MNTFDKIDSEDKELRDEIMLRAWSAIHDASRVWAIKGKDLDAMYETVKAVYVHLQSCFPWPDGDEFMESSAVTVEDFLTNFPGKEACGFEE